MVGDAYEKASDSYPLFSVEFFDGSGKARQPEVSNFRIVRRAASRRVT